MRHGLSLDSLLVLSTIAEKGSFAAAAHSLHRVPSAITYSVQRLEQALEIAIFNRSGHRAELTEAGKSLLNEGRQLLEIAHRMERKVKRVATGWEAELRIAIGEVIQFEHLLPLIEDFSHLATDTQLRFSFEVLGGTWDALLSNRADLVLGAPGDAPAANAFGTLELGQVEFLLAMHPAHPLAGTTEPLRAEQIRCHRAIAAADTSKSIAPRTVGLQPGQPVLTVPDLNCKRLALLRGLGIGRLPRHLIQRDLERGDLITKKTDTGSPTLYPVYAAWQHGQPGKGLAWWIHTLKLHRQRKIWFTIS